MRLGVLIKTLAENRWFALADLGCALLATAIWYRWPRAGGWPLLIALLPWAVRTAAGRSAFRRTIFDLPLAAFLVTAAMGVWATYDPAGGWAKFWVLVGSVFLYYSLAGQPRENLWIVTGLLGLLGVSLAGLFLIGQDFRQQPADLQAVEWVSQGWASLRPGALRFDFQPNLLAGVLAVLAPFPIAAGLAAVRSRTRLVALAAALAAGLTGFALLLSSSRGAWLALSAGLAAWLADAYGGPAVRRFPKRPWKWLVLAGLLAAAVALGLVITSPERAAGLSGQLPGGPSTGSRLELARSALFLVGDYPFTGGGLGAFPGLYAQYVQVIPFFVFGYSHNFYLDVALEQGVFGFLALAAIFLGSAGLAVTSTARLRGDFQARVLSQAVLAGLLVAVFHGLIDDPLYGGRGTPLVFMLPGLAVAVSRQTSPVKDILPASSSRRVLLGGFASRRYRRWWVPALAALVLLAGFAVWRPLLASWYANLGAVLLSRAELSGFPKEEWDADGYSEAGVSAAAQSAGLLFERALELDPNNATAAYRLGLIALAERDYPQAIRNLEIAHQAKPGQRGITKTLGYGYVWSGQPDRALALLSDIPEAPEEMGVYAWWWEARGREDLAARSAAAAAQLAGLFAEPLEEEK